MVQLILQALNKDPAKRPQSAEEFRQNLETAAESKNFLRKHRQPAPALMVALSILSILSVITLLGWKSVDSSNKSRQRSQQYLKSIKNNSIEQIIVRSPAVTLMEHGVLAFNHRDWRSAKQFYEAALTKLPEKMRAKRRECYHRLYNIYMGLDSKNEAREALRKALSLADSDDFGFKSEVYISLLHSLDAEKKFSESDDIAKKL